MTAIDPQQTRQKFPGFYLSLSLEARILLVIFSLLAIWGLAIFTFGIPALLWPMKLIVPAGIAMLFILTWFM
ncbi:MAG: hypothetical protein KJN60_09985 [Boseongicola sp.]|nr:hypothetical protein [Boseongicola sp.]